jgi:hypothetical protein
VYDPADYAEAMRLLNCSVLLGSERHPVCAQDEQVMGYYIAAFHKVYNALDEVVADDTIGRASARATPAPA